MSGAGIRFCALSTLVFFVIAILAVLCTCSFMFYRRHIILACHRVSLASVFFRVYVVRMPVFGSFFLAIYALSVRVNTSLLV